MLQTKFLGNQSADSGEENFRRAFTIYGRCGHLGHVTSIMSSNFNFLVPESFQTKFGSVVSEKIQFGISYVHDLGPWSRNDLDLQYSHTLIHSIRCLLLPTFWSLAAILSEKSTVFTFFL